ncbi:hypothetical protein [Catellatospora bangladeshensis]|uniref:Secreted protein n=1 Tax=Catellatospora bangladeshensis TaxID=310355 RepID=A0A8J3NNT2_9ACTN|nr:hypothetical protein [Catellatospora bangladeshensis]GIF86443.1 hypothetical protein Cba03nite_77920 [Catellatospora bangladeshensis]
MNPSLSRRQLLAAGAAAAAGGLGAAALGGTAHAAPAGFPTYRYLGTPFTKANLRYNPTNELIFPCIRGVYDKISSPLGRYYLYYAPHDAPGGICLAYGDSLSGQFTEYPNNPIVSNVWSPHYSVSHVSSPHVIWNAANSKFYMYFHGENNTTRMAWSTDGVNFTYFGRVLHTGVIPGSTETSYARVFEHAVPGLGNKYVMVFMGVTNGTRKIFWGWSADGKTFSFDPTPLVTPGPDGQTDIAAPHLLKRNNTTYVVYHGNGGDMFLTEVGNSFDREVHLGVFHPAMDAWPDRGRAAAASFGTDGGVQYMFYEAGPRLDGTIAVARAV